jgi:type IV pilus assembly protein PilW
MTIDYKQQQGFNLVELLLALFVGLSLLLGVLSVFVGMRTTTKETSSYGQIQENGRFAISLITDDLLRQGFWGDFTGKLDTSALVTSPDPSSVSLSDCIGAGENNASFPSAFGHFRTLWGDTVESKSPMTCINNAKMGSDLIQLKRSVSLPIAPENILSSKYYLIANPNSAAIFSGVQAIPSLNFAQIWEYQHHVYYVREETQGSQKVPVLVQGRLQNKNSIMALDMVVEGIEMMRFMYGVDSDNDGVVNAFISADSMTNAFWDNENDTTILAVKLYILARDILPDNKYINKNTYQLGDWQFTANDNYRRMLFNTTVTLHNARIDSWQ